jgi:Ca-activated chloride channel family protein
MSEFHFLRPLWLLALIPLAGLSWHLIRLGREGGDWRRVCDPALLPFILLHDLGGKPARRASWLFTLGGALAILSLAGPAWERLPVPAYRNEAALVIALDLSHIMEATDLKPSRLDRARFKIADLLKQRKDGLTAMLVYSGDAFTVTPLTDDNGTINSQLSALTTDLMPAQGSRADLALELAGRLLKQSGLTRGDILLITNGGGLSKAFDAAKELKAQGYRVSVLGAGSEDGAPVPLPEGGFLQDSKGNIIISKLAVPALRQLAEDGGGLFRKLTTDNSDLEALLPFFLKEAQPGQLGETENGIKVEQWEERGVWLLLVLLPIAALGFRRGYLAMMIVLVLPLPRPAHALEWQDLWQTRDQQASQAFQAGDLAKAAESFDNPAWKAAAHYKAGHYEEAAKTLQGQESADAQYNLGNALAKQGQYPQAIAAYNQALKQDPNNEDARYNKELLEKAMKDQQPQEQDKKPSGKGQDPDKDQQKKQEKGDQQQGKNQPQDQDQQQDDQSKGKQGQQQQEPSGQQENPQTSEKKDQGKEEEQQARQGEQQQPKDEQGQDAEQASKAQGDKPEQPETEKKGLASADLHQKEDSQAIEQWLRRIPDDPGGLLRRKFQYQYQQRQSQRGQ